MKWWEKTVEYSFVYLAAKEKIFNLFAPLDGDVEVIGDAVVGKDSKYFILEFKKTLSNLSSEYAKYNGGKDGYLAAAAIMTKKPCSKFHYLIGGKELQRLPYISLEARRYFEDGEEPTSDIKTMFKHGMTLEQLNTYTQELTMFKKSNNNDGTGDSDSGGMAFEQVLAVSEKERKATLIPLQYFKGPVPKPELKNEYKSSISRGPT